MFIRTSNRLVLRYKDGQFTFRHFIPNATNQELSILANGLNALQEGEATHTLRVEEFELAI